MWKRILLSLVIIVILAGAAVFGRVVWCMFGCGWTTTVARFSCDNSELKLSHHNWRSWNVMRRTTSLLWKRGSDWQLVDGVGARHGRRRYKPPRIDLGDFPVTVFRSPADNQSYWAVAVSPSSFSPTEYQALVACVQENLKELNEGIGAEWQLKKSPEIISMSYVDHSTLERTFKCASTVHLHVLADGTVQLREGSKNHMRYTHIGKIISDGAAILAKKKTVEELRGYSMPIEQCVDPQGHSFGAQYQINETDYYR